MLWKWKWKKGKREKRIQIDSFNKSLNELAHQPIRRYNITIYIYNFIFIIAHDVSETRWQNSTKRFAFFVFIAIDSSFRINENARLSFIAFCFYPNFGYVRCWFGLIWKRKTANYSACLSPHRFTLIYLHLYIRNTSCIRPNSVRRRNGPRNLFFSLRCVNYVRSKKRLFFSLSGSTDLRLLFISSSSCGRFVLVLFFFSGSSLVRSTHLSLHGNLLVMPYEFDLNYYYLYFVFLVYLVYGQWFTSFSTK